MPKQQHNLDSGLRAVRALIKRWAQNQRPAKSFTPSMMFSKEGFGSLTLDREEANKFEEALSMLSPDEGLPRATSRATVDALIREAVLTSLDILKKQKGTSLDDRIDVALQNLRTKLRAQP